MNRIHTNQYKLTYPTVFVYCAMTRLGFEELVTMESFGSTPKSIS